MNRQSILFCVVAGMLVVGLMTFDPGNHGLKEVPQLVAQELVGGVACDSYAVNRCYPTTQVSEGCLLSACYTVRQSGQIGTFSKPSAAFSCAANSSCATGIVYQGLYDIGCGSSG